MLKDIKRRVEATRAKYSWPIPAHWGLKQQLEDSEEMLRMLDGLYAGLGWPS